MAGLSRENTPPSFRAAMDTILPPFKDLLAVISSGWGPRNVRNGSGNHKALDIAYPETVPAGTVRVFSPVNGTVNSIGPSYNTISIRDGGGFLHQFLHNERVLVNVGQQVSVGTPIGLMGGRGPNGSHDYVPHVHYQLKSPEGKLLNPLNYWDNTKQMFVNLPRQENGLPVEDNSLSDSITSFDLAASEVEFHNQLEEGNEPTISAYRPRMPAIAPKSGTQGALLPNRRPGHEPWPRVMYVNTENINGLTDEVEYNTRFNRQHDAASPAGAKLIGRIEGDETIIRGPFWRR